MTRACMVQAMLLRGVHSSGIDTVFPLLTTGDIFALERLKAAGVNQLSKGT
ncbi:hypothetical protein WMY93_025480 [Mugilogobius chulae]|uniref:Uncharacterized protein n=1 Tax=Mugilogobius chulae TaxID=88201 RepID=A0AAW0N7J5_9GOBI